MEKKKKTFPLQQNEKRKKSECSHHDYAPSKTSGGVSSPRARLGSHSAAPSTVPAAERGVQVRLRQGE